MHLRAVVDTLDRRSRWQVAVDTLYRLAVCGLIYTPSLEGAKSLISYIDELSGSDPFPGSDFPLLWNQVDIFGSKLNSELMERFGIIRTNGEPNRAFHSMLRSMFADNGVPLEMYPVKPIVLQA